MKEVTVALLGCTLLMTELLSTRFAKIIFGYNFQFIIISLALLGVGFGAILAHYKTLPKYWSALYALSVPLPFMVAHFKEVLPAMASFFAVLLVTYTLAGYSIALLLKQATYKRYAGVMIGSAIGCLLAILTLNQYGNTGAVILLFVLAVVAATMLWRWSILLAFLLLLLPSMLSINCGSSARFPSDNIYAQESNAHAYLETTKRGENHFRISIDCVGVTTAVGMNINNSFVYTHPNALPFLAKNYSSVLLLGAGAGAEAVRAMHSSANITAVEINPLIIERAAKITSPFVYDDPRVTLHVQEARSFIEADSQKYDLIHLGGTKRYGGVGMNDFIFVENYLFTKEAITTYLDHLHDGGYLYIRDLQPFIARYANTIAAAVSESMHPAQSMLFFTKGSAHSAILVKKGVLSKSEIANLTRVAARIGMTVQPYSYPLSDTVISDDNPFFWNAQPIRLHGYDQSTDRWTNRKDLWLLFWISLVVFLLVLWPSRNMEQGYAGFVSLIGIGYIILQLGFVHKLTLFLPHPLQALTVVLATFLLFGGLGSLWAPQVRIKTMIWCLVGYMVVFIVVISGIIHAGFGWSSLTKVFIAIALTSIPALFMGTLLPKALASTKNLPYYFGLNSVAIVFGSVAAMLTALYAGFVFALLLGMLCYAIALHFAKSAAL